jgi:regulator of CtrA degradation
VSVSNLVMSNVSRAESGIAAQNVTVSFGERFQASAQFDGVFKQGMALVERTAAYLEGPGRVEAKRLPAGVNVLYASESMRLTTRLLDLASWLLIRRALKEGDISETEAQKKRKGVALQAPSRSSHVGGFGELPEGLRSLVEESYALQDRIVQLDRAMSVKSDNVSAAVEPVLANPVGTQIDKLRLAFAR